uniref:Uncharacterized protein n=1 Tax=Cacopsylla melanoneura TaxID=428564 RepID=A0A8D8X3A0_9HEMI
MNVESDFFHVFIIQSACVQSLVWPDGLERDDVQFKITQNSYLGRIVPSHQVFCVNVFDRCGNLVGVSGPRCNPMRTISFVRTVPTVVIPVTTSISGHAPVVVTVKCIRPVTGGAIFFVTSIIAVQYSIAQTLRRGTFSATVDFSFGPPVVIVSKPGER